MIPQVQLTPRRPITRAQKDTRAFPLTEKPPVHDCTADSLHKIIDFLDVEKSARYQPIQTATYCNIYAYDYAYACGAFIPRVWWTAEAIRTNSFTPSYGKTVTEMNANALYDWFPKHGPAFGWKEVNFAEAQRLANAGNCVVLIAANKNRARSGHITAVVPETDKVKAVGSQGIIVYPVQSQAGRVNRKYFNTKWWDGHEPVKAYAKVG
jgi:hypothetical protein